MKLYLVEPAIPSGASEAEVDLRLKASIEPIADLILPYLMSDPAVFGIRHTHESSKPVLPMTKRYGHTMVVHLADRSMLRRALVACGDPNSGQFMLIRSLVTCRSVRYGYDGQAFVCLPYEDEPMRSPDTSMIEVNDRSELLIDTDYMDGILSD